MKKKKEIKYRFRKGECYEYKNGKYHLILKYRGREYFRAYNKFSKKTVGINWIVFDIILSNKIEHYSIGDEFSMMAKSIRGHLEPDFADINRVKPLKDKNTP